VAYLTHSSYGRNENEITINNNQNYLTGNAGDTVSATSSETTHPYNIEKGMLASTSGNIYGIYDMSGGTYEYIATWDTESTSSDINNVGSSFASPKGESTKYATVYHNGTTSYYPTSENSILGDATYEVNVDIGNSNYAWFRDYSYCAYVEGPFFRRGGTHSNETNAGVFCSGYHHGDSDTHYSFRVVVPGGDITDRIAPTIKSVTTTSGRTDGFTISIDAEDNFGGVGLAEGNAYTIYYRKKGESTYQSVTTSNNVYQFTELTPTIETSQTNPPKLKEGMNPVIWLDLNENGTIEEATEEITKYTNLTTKTINPKWTANNGDSHWSYYNQVTDRNL